MRPGGSKSKGSSFERELCKTLSRWVSHGKKDDLFWRSAMSGGRATVSARKGYILKRQAGDISAIAPEGHALTDRFLVELKHVKNLALLQFFAKGTGPLAEYWRKAKGQAVWHKLEPMIIARQNNMPTVLIMHEKQIERLLGATRPQQRMLIKQKGRLGVEIYLLSDVLSCEFSAAVDV